MFPPSQGLRLDIDAVSQICGSVSIACWIVVFSPQIIENWRRRSAEGLSVVFIVIWLLGDFFNIIGAVLQGVLPTMIILAVYYTFADIILLGQCFWYKGFTLRDEVNKSTDVSDSESEINPGESAPLLQRPDLNNRSNGDSTGNGYYTPPRISDVDRGRRPSAHSQNSYHSFRERILSTDGAHFNPVTPFVPPNSDLAEGQGQSQSKPAPTTSTLQTVLFNIGIVLLVCAAGVFGWWLSARRSTAPPPVEDGGTLHFNIWGQIFGYICAALYLGSRVPQLLLNYRRKSTEGISMLFFLFACIGNLTYVLSILAYKPICKHPKHCETGEAGAIYGRYIAVNFSWLLGSFGTLLLDAGVFIQYFLYRDYEDSDEEEEEEEDLLP